MTNSYTTTYSETESFTISDARYLSAKVAVDLKRIQRFYGEPSDKDIFDYEEEMIKLLYAGFLDKVTYGFKRGEKWIEPTLEYTAEMFNFGYSDDDAPGRIRPNCDIQGASFFSYLIYNNNWEQLSYIDKSNFLKSLPFQRNSAEEPGIEGNFDNQKFRYSKNGLTLIRSDLRKYR